jgi:hypothetical protein
MNQLVQIVGALLVLAAFGAAQAGWMSVTSLSYLVLNAVGSAILCALGVINDQWGFVLLEGAWALITLWSLATRGGERPRAQTH